MDESASSVESVIGGRVRRARQARRWTLDQMAGAAGLSRRTAVNVEQGCANPSIGTLLRIGDGLGVGLPALVESPAPNPIRVTRHGAGALLWSSKAGGRGVLVAGTAPPDVVELWEWTLGPHDRCSSAAHVLGTRELIQVRKGTITIDSGTDPVTLKVGDAVVFPGDLAHSYANSSTRSATFSLAVFEPGVGSRSRSEASDA